MRHFRRDLFLPVSYDAAPRHRRRHWPRRLLSLGHDRATSGPGDDRPAPDVLAVRLAIGMRNPCLALLALSPSRRLLRHLVPRTLIANTRIANTDAPAFSANRHRGTARRKLRRTHRHRAAAGRQTKRGPGYKRRHRRERPLVG